MDGRLDAFIAVRENGPRGVTQDPVLMEEEHRQWVEAGVLDPEQPTPWSHYQYQESLRREFTEEERIQIRIALGMVPL